MKIEKENLGIIISMCICGDGRLWVGDYMWVSWMVCVCLCVENKLMDENQFRVTAVKSI